MKATQVASLEPIKDDTQESHEGLDEVSGGFSLTRLLTLVSDCDNQPQWRNRCDVAAAYVDGKQFTPEQQAAAFAEGMPDARPTNLIGRVIRSVCGTEAKARTDVKVEADDDDVADVTDALNPKLKEAQRETYADMAVSAAYFGQVGPGLGWVEVARNADPLDYNYRCASVHRSEMWWDFKAKDLLLRDARWMARKTWQDLDELEAAMPQFRALFRGLSNGWGGFQWDNTIDETVLQTYRNASECESRWGNYQRRTEWFDSARKRVKLYEVWYKVSAWGVVLHMSPTRRVLFDETNQAHIQAVATGQVRVSRELTKQVRMSLFAGPHRIQDIGTTKRNFPYVPFIAYQDDEDLSPYGLVEGMISPQDEYNSRRLRINWMLRARQMTLDNDALDTKANSLAEVAATLMRPDRLIVLDPNRKHESALNINSDVQLQKEQVEVMQDAKQLIQDVPGVYGSQLGQAQSGVTSGIANSLLIEQGAVAMGDLNDNYRHARRMVFENLLDLIVEDCAAPNMPVKIGNGSNRRVVILNQWDPQSMQLLNNVKDAPNRVGLGEVPSTPAFRMQQQQQIATIINALAASSPQAVAVLAPSFIESTDLPDRLERADDLRRATGLPTMGDRDAAKKMEEKQAAEAEKAAAQKDKMIGLQIQKEAATVEKIMSDTKLNEAKVIDLGHQMATRHQQEEPEAPEPAERETPDEMEQRLIAEAIAEAHAAMSA